LFEETENVV